MYLLICCILMQDAAPAPLLLSGSSGIVTVLLALPRRLVLSQTSTELLDKANAYVDDLKVTD